MTHDNHAGEVQPARTGLLAKRLDRATDVQEGPRIAAARFAEAPIFDVPDGVAFPGQRLGRGVHDVQAVLGLPAAAMDQDDHGAGVAASADWIPELGELGGFGAVRQARARLRRRRLEVGGRHERRLAAARERHGDRREQRPQHLEPA
jgi:hypothetical protein